MSSTPPGSIELLRRLLVKFNQADEAKLTSEEAVIKAAQAAMSQPEGRRLLVVSGGVLDELTDGQLLDKVWIVDCDNGEQGDRYVLPPYMRDLCERFWGEVPEYVCFEDEDDKPRAAPREEWNRF